MPFMICMKARTKNKNRSKPRILIGTATRKKITILHFMGIYLAPVHLFPPISSNDEVKKDCYNLQNMMIVAI